MRRPRAGSTWSTRPYATHSLRLDDINQVTIAGINYREFFLDIQETSSAPRLSVDELRVFLGPDGVQSNYGSGMLNGITPIYNLDNGVDNWIKLDITVNPAGTVGDMVAYIPNSLFANPSSNPYVYLYSKFGSNFSSDGSFEEWWVNSPLAPPPSNPVHGTYESSTARLRPCCCRSEPPEVSARAR